MSAWPLLINSTVLAPNMLHEYLTTERKSEVPVPRRAVAYHEPGQDIMRTWVVCCLTDIGCELSVFLEENDILALVCAVHAPYHPHQFLQ